MKPREKFAVKEFTNPSGEIVYRVDGRINGERIRKNFATRKEAETERQLLEIQGVQKETGVRVAATRLTDAQLQEAEGAFQRLEGQKRPLIFFVEFALANYVEPERQKSLKDAVADYFAAKEHELKQDHICRSQMGRIRMDLRKLMKHFPGAAVSELTVAKLVSFFELGRPSLKTYNNRRGIVGTFLKFCFRRGWIAENPVLKVPQHRIRRRRGMATTFSATQAAELMAFLETHEKGIWVPYFALTLFAGVRPGVPDGEITKLKPEAVNLDTGIITISGEVSKVREPRRITIQPNLAAWLRAYHAVFNSNAEPRSFECYFEVMVLNGDVVVPGVEANSIHPLGPARHGASLAAAKDTDPATDQSELIPIVFVAGDRGGTQRNQIQIPREYDAIKEALGSAKHRDSFLLANPVLAATHKKLVTAYRERPRILHFAGHGDERSLSLIADDGVLVSEIPIIAEQLASILKSFPVPVRLCVLNACDSAVIARRLVEEKAVEAAVGWNGKVADDIASAFSKAFYGALGDGLSLVNCVKLAAGSHPSGIMALLHGDGAIDFTKLMHPQRIGPKA